MASYPTLHEIRAAADDYWSVWQELLSAHPELRQAVGQHSPTAMGWKVEGDLSPLEAAERLYELGDHVFLGPVNEERGILTIHKVRPVALAALQDVKILQRRPSRPEDALGPDSLDFLLPHGVPEVEPVKKAAGDAEIEVQSERNDMHHWLSVRYRGHEFKLKDRTVWEVCAREAALVAGKDLATS